MTMKIEIPNKLGPIDYDKDMDRFYIPVNSSYEVQTKGKGSSFRIANTKTGERHLIIDEHIHEFIEDMAKGCHAEMVQLHSVIEVYQKFCGETLAMYAGAMDKADMLQAKLDKLLS